MRWVIAMGLIAGCGRIGFDPLGSGTGTGTGGDDGSTDTGSGSGSGSGSGGAVNAYYIASGSKSQSAPTTAISATTLPLTDSNMVLVVAIHWGNATSTVTTVQDTFGNGFSMVGSMTRYNAAQSQIIWFKKITAGTTINVAFDQAAPSVDLKWAAYRNIDQVSPTIGMLGGAGTSTTADSGAMSLTSLAVLVASSGSRAPTAMAGPGYAERQNTGGGVLEDRTAAQGDFNATATLSSSNDWIIQLVALRAM